MASKKDYKIIPIQHLLKGNKIAKSGDIVKGSQFINLQDSLDRGFCKEVKNTKSKEEVSKADEGIDLSKLSIKELLAFAVDNSIELSEEVKNSKTKAPIVDAIVESI